MLFSSNLPRTFRSNSYISSDAVPYRIQIFSKPLTSGCHNIMKRLTILRRSQRWTIHFLNSLSAAYNLTPDASNSWISLLLIDTLLWILMLWKACGSRRRHQGGLNGKWLKTLPLYKVCILVSGQCILISKKSLMIP